MFAYAILMTLAAAAPATAAQPAAKCTAKPPLPAELAGWDKATSAKTMGDYGPLSERWPPLGTERTGLALRPAIAVTFWAKPEKESPPDTFGGMIPVRIAKAGTVKIALSDAAWIDLVRDGKPLASTAHGHGPDCSGIRKIVSFDVKPGLHILQISGSQNRAISAMAILP